MSVSEDLKELLRQGPNRSWDDFVVGRLMVRRTAGTVALYVKVLGITDEHADFWAGCASWPTGRGPDPGGVAWCVNEVLTSERRQRERWPFRDGTLTIEEHRVAEVMRL